MKCNIVVVLALLFPISLNAQIRQTDEEKTIQLDSINVTAQNISHGINGVCYLINEMMKERSSSFYEMLNLLPSVRFDRISNKITVDNKSNVAFLVNSKPVSSDYLQSLDHKMINSITIQKNPTGRFADYDAVVNVNIKVVNGIDISLANLLIVNPNNNDGDPIMMEQPSTAVSVNIGRFSVFTSAVYGKSKWNTPASESSQLDISNNQLSSWMERYRYTGNREDLLLNYRISPNHEISAETIFSHENVRTSTDHLNIEGNELYSTNNKSCIPFYSTLLFYNGKIKDRVKIYSELVYSHQNNDGEYYYRLASNGITTLFDENKHTTRFQTVLSIQGSERYSIETGYKFDYLHFQQNQQSPYLNHRNNVWLDFQYNIKDGIDVEGGIAFETYNASEYACRKYLLPSLKLSIVPNDNMSYVLAYRAKSAYPTMTMLNQISTYRNPGVSEIGNVKLKPEIRHEISLTSSLFDAVTISPTFERSNDKIIPMVFKNDKNEIVLKYQNVKVESMTLPVSVQLPLGEHFMFETDAAYYILKAEYNNQRKQLDGWCVSADLMYFNEAYMADLSYSRNITKENLIQGYSEEGVDAWALTMSKQWLNGNLAANLSWYLPIEFGARKQTKSSIKTDFYSECRLQETKPYRNAILLSLSYRFTNGKVKLSRKRTEIEAETRIENKQHF